MTTEEWNDLPPGGREPMKRPSSPAMDALLGRKFPVLDHGFVRLIDYMGDETAVVQAARVSYGIGTKTVSEDVSLLRYLMRHRHTTPFEMCEIKLHVKLPIFVARQWVRHRTASINEVSARYSILASEFYVPDDANVAPQSKTNKQGRAHRYTENDAMMVRAVLRAACEDAFRVYTAVIDEDAYDLAREIARTVLPVSAYTEWYWKVDLHNLLHFLTLRAHPHAQYEIRVYADLILEQMVKAWVPNIFSAFEDYTRNAATFSGKEMAILRSMIERSGMTNHEIAMLRGLSGREQSAFLATLNLPDPGETA